MSFDVLGPGALDYLPCRYGTSRLLFRGPKRDLKVPYISFIGGTETYGKFIDTPFPALIEQDLGTTCVNFGLPNAGIDAFVHDPFVIEASMKASVTVVQVMGAHNMTNRFYAVHPRRNDRFVSSSAMLNTIFREVDFADFHFNKHMLGKLIQVSADRFDTVREELTQAWLARMRLILNQIPGKTILLWLAEDAPPNASDIDRNCLGSDPLFITREMLDEVAKYTTAVVEVVASKSAKEAGTEGMQFAEMEAVAASEMLGPITHREAAKALMTAINELT